MPTASVRSPPSDANDLAAALKEGSDTAYKGVVKPVEGTILTVIRESADNARRAAAVEHDIEFVLNHTVQAAGEAVEKTPSLLPVLAKAGVVDSGGKGLFFILEGMYKTLRGDRLEVIEELATLEPAVAAISLDPHNLPPVRYGFDVQFLIWGNDLDVDSIRQRITEMGDCPLVEGTSTLIKVHVHHFDPGVPLAYGVSQGFITDVVVENMDAMSASGTVPDDVKDELSTAPVQVVAHQIDGIGIIAVAPGQGLREVFTSLGVSAVVSGGQTMNPSAQELSGGHRIAGHRQNHPAAQQRQRGACRPAGAPDRSRAYPRQAGRGCAQPHRPPGHQRAAGMQHAG